MTGASLMMDQVATSRDDAVIVRRYNVTDLRFLAFTLPTGVQVRLAWRGINETRAIVLSSYLQVAGCNLGAAAPLVVHCWRYLAKPFVPQPAAAIR